MESINLILQSQLYSVSRAALSAAAPNFKSAWRRAFYKILQIFMPVTATAPVERANIETSEINTSEASMSSKLRCANSSRAALENIICKSLVFTVSFLLFIYSSASAKAQSDEELIKELSLGLQPPIIEIDTEIPSTHTLEFTLTNPGNVDMLVNIQTKDFLPSDDKGSVRMFLSADQPDNPFAASQWLTPLENNFPLAPGAQKKVEVELVVPHDAIIGGHYGAVAFRTVPVEKFGVWELRGEVGSLVFINTGGVEKRSVELHSTNFSRIIWPWRNLPINFTLRGTGNTYVIPEIAIEIKNPTGKAIQKIQTDQHYILPGYKHQYDMFWFVPTQTIWPYYQMQIVIGDSDGIQTHSYYLFNLVYGIVGILFISFLTLLRKIYKNRQRD